MTYDDAGWHQDSVGEHGLDPDCTATHIGMFFAWLVLRPATVAALEGPARLRLWVEGPDEQDAAQAILQLFADRFHEGDFRNMRS